MVSKIVFFDLTNKEGENGYFTQLKHQLKLHTDTENFPCLAPAHRTKRTKNNLSGKTKI